jgi:hypothetical protein
VLKLTGEVSAGKGWRAKYCATAIKSSEFKRFTTCAMQSGACARRWPDCHAPSWPFK